jgi:CheY-like chemotaxis protein
MAQRRALLIDSDPGFNELLSRVLAPYAVEIHAVTDGSDGLSTVPDLTPELIFISVELPDKVGYSICNKAKKGVAKNIPVILATSSVPPSDLAQHRKLKVHADEYIDKRTVTPEELLDKIGSIINLGPPVAEAGEYELNVDAEDIHFDDEPSVHISEAETTAVASAADVDPGIDAETEAVFAGLVDDEEAQAGAVEQPASEDMSGPQSQFDAQRTGVRAPPPLPADALAAESPDATAQEGLDLGLESVAEDAGATPEGANLLATSSRLAELEHEIESLREQLAEARRAGPPAPTQFSREREFLNLREVINRKEKEILDLRDEVDAKDRVILGGKDKIRELERRRSEGEEKLLAFEGQLVTANETVAALKADKDKAHEREKGLKARIEMAQAQLRKTEDELEATKKRTAAEIQALGAEIVARKKEVEKEKKDAADRAAQVQAQSAAALKKAADEAAERLAARERALADERDRQLASLRADLGDKLERQKQEAAQAAAAAQAEHEKKLAALAAERQQAVARLEKERDDAVARLGAEKEQALAEAEQRRESELHQAEQRRHSDLRAAEDKRVLELAEAEERAQRAAEEAEAKRQADVAEVRAEMQAALAAAEARRAEEVAAAEAKHAEELAAAEERRMKELFAADTKRREELTAAETRRKDEVAALEDQNIRELGALKRAHDEQTEIERSAREEAEARLRGELGRLEGELGGARERIRALEKDGDEREAKLAVQKGETERLERENADLQEQLLRAYQKIKADEAIANKAKKAMAIALTLLDGEPKALATQAPAPANGERETESS